MLLAAFSFSNAKADGDSLRLGYCKGNPAVYEKVNTENKVGASAVFFTAEKMSTFNGGLINSVSVSFDDKTKDGAVKVFITKDLNAAPLYTQTFTAKAGWNVFTFDTPFSIDGEAIYLGYEVSGMIYLRYCNPLVIGEEWISIDNKGWQRYAKAYSAAIYANVIGEGLPYNNVALSNASLAEYAEVGKTASYSATFINLGSANVTAVKAVLYDGDKEIYSELVEGLNVKPLDSKQFTIKNFIPSAEGDYNIRLAVVEVNGKPDDDMTDNYSRSQTLLCRNTFTQRKILLEVFSTERCTGCPNAHNSLDKMLEDKPEVVEIGHHAGFYTDPFSIQASIDYEWFYKENKLYAPAIMMDRTYRGDNYPSYFTDGVPVMSSVSYVNGMYTVSKSTPAQVSLAVDATLNEQTRHLSVSVSGKQLLPLVNAETTHLYVMLTEDSVFTENQAGSPGSFYHRHIARLCMTPTWGDKVDATNDFTLKYEADIPADWNISMMQAVAFVGNYDSTNKNNCPVYNTEVICLKNLLSTSGIDDVEASESAVIKLVGNEIVIPAGAEQLAVYDMSGRLLLSNKSFTTRLQLPVSINGMAVVKAKVNGQFVVEKINFSR